MKVWSHLQDILESDSSALSGRLVVVAVSASIACVESHRLARGLMRHGAQVQFVLTPSARDLVSPTALGWSTGRAPVLELTARCEHLEYFGVHGKADLLLLAPCTANTLAKISMGLDDNAVTTFATTALGIGVPVLCALGMHEPMMNNPAVAANLERVKGYGIEILSPVLSEGKQKMMAVPEIVARVKRTLGPADLQGRRVLITGGPTREFLDPARCLTNPSSGLTACLLAEEAYRRGAEVTLVYGPGRYQPASWIEVERVVSAGEMEWSCRKLLREKEYDFCIACAAVSDFKPSIIEERKRPTAEGGFELALEVTPKVLDALRAEAPRAKIVAFKAASSSSDEELARAILPYLESRRADFVVGNSITIPGHGFDSDSNRYLVAGSGQVTAFGPARKSELARLLWTHLLDCSRNTGS